MNKNPLIEKVYCPECKSSFISISTKEAICKNRHSFKVVKSVPILLTKHSERELRKNRKSSMGIMMEKEYHMPAKGNLQNTIKKIFTSPNIDIRMYDIEKVFNKVTYNESDKHFIVSVGGGPVRDKKNVINLNIDLYPNVEIVGDAHNLPFKNNSVDGIIINAVLEHLENPQKAVEEIYRVLKRGGYVFAETPFLQHYHGYPFHFQNFTLTGHNYLFRKFTILQSGPVTGPFCTLVTFMLNLSEDFISNKYIRKIILYFVGFILLPIRLLDNFYKANTNTFKLTSGVYLLAQKR